MADRLTNAVYTGLGASNHSDKERNTNDFYATPPLAVRQLLEVETFNNNVWECAYGMGHIGKVFEEKGYKVLKSDIHNYNNDSDVHIVDFLSCSKQWKGDIVTNPPYILAQQFVEKAMDLVNEGAKVAMFLKIQFLEGKKRREMFKKYPPKRIYVAVNRFGCSTDGVFDKNENLGSAVCYCWYVWEKGFVGNPEIHWINER